MTAEWSSVMRKMSLPRMRYSRLSPTCAQYASPPRSSSAVQVVPMPPYRASDAAVDTMTLFACSMDFAKERPGSLVSSA